MPPCRARRCSSTVSTSAACRAPRAPSGAHRRRRRFRLRLGRAARHAEEPALALHTRARPPRRARAEGRRLAPGRGHHRQRLGVPGPRVRRRRHWTRRPPALHQGRPPRLQRLRRAPPANDPRGVLAARLRALASTPIDRARARPRRIPPLLQPRPRPHRTPDQGTGARRYRPRRPQNKDREMSENCRYISGLGRPSRQARS
jgi:hypothetical protein